MIEASPLVPEFCYAPGTPWELIERNSRRALWSRLAHSVSPSAAKYRADDRWTSTATDGGGIAQGEPLTLTWSVVPDGTSIFGYNGEATADSDLRAFLDGIYGSEAVWRPIFQQVFDRWSELTGITYAYEPNDDGDPWTQFTIASGNLGVRGDIRIAGHRIDGNFGVLAYNFFPNTGDMVIDTDDNFYSSTGGNSLGLRNVLAHEHGHGIGLSHVCPVNQTKLMEPFVSSAFDGPQHDDIRGGQRNYGDPDEMNDSRGTAADLGSPMGAVALADRGLDDNSDIDFYSFTVDSDAVVDVTVTPVGLTYLEGPQNANGSCTAGSNLNSLTVHDLSVRILDPSGTQVALADANGAGLAETLSQVALQQGAGTYTVEISGDATDDIQLYELELDVALGPGIFSNGFEDGTPDAWSSFSP